MYKHLKEEQVKEIREKVNELIENRVEIYGMAYKDILPEDTIYNSKVFWRSELLDIADLFLNEFDSHLGRAMEETGKDIFHELPEWQFDEEKRVKEFISQWFPLTPPKGE